jgi:hypothetical protein
MGRCCQRARSGPAPVVCLVGSGEAQRILEEGEEMTVPGPPWTPEEDALLRSMGRPPKAPPRLQRCSSAKRRGCISGLTYSRSGWRARCQVRSRSGNNHLHGPGNIRPRGAVVSIASGRPFVSRCPRLEPLGLLLWAEGDREMTDDPNEAYEVVPIEPGPHGRPVGWWTVKRNGLPVRHFPGKENAQRFATDPEYRASLAAGKAWKKAKG